MDDWTNITLSFPKLTIARRQRGVCRPYRSGELTLGQFLHGLRSLQLPGAVADLTGIVDFHFEYGEQAIEFGERSAGILEGERASVLVLPLAVFL